MKKIALLLSFICFAVSFSIAQEKITTFILVRHAEKASDGTNNPALTPQGTDRAKRLARMLEKTTIDAIYSTAFKRTQLTVEPLATEKHLDIKTYEASKAPEIEKMLKAHAGGTIVVSGHSNTTPWIANLLTGTEQYKEFDDTDYGNMIVVSVLSIGKTTHVTWLRY